MPKRKPQAPQIPDARKLFKRAREVITETVVDEMELWADDIREEFVERIEAQAFASFQVVLYPDNGTNLSPEWLARKEAAGADERTMIATRTYIDGIAVFKTYDRKQKKWVVRVGFHPLAKPRDLKGRLVNIEIPGTGITGLTALGIVHELGSIKANIPARPHWRPHLTKVKGESPAKHKAVRRTASRALKDDRRLKKLVVGAR